MTLVEKNAALSEFKDFDVVNYARAHGGLSDRLFQ
jgi:hypothetical protein